MDYLISCACGHTLEQHGSDNGCEHCPCSRNRVSALEALIEAIREDSTRSQPNDAFFTQLRST